MENSNNPYLSLSTYATCTCTYTKIQMPDFRTICHHKCMLTAITDEQWTTIFEVYVVSEIQYTFLLPFVHSFPIPFNSL